MSDATGRKIRIGDKIFFEVEDTLHEKGIRVVNAQVIRSYPQPLGKHASALAIDCIDLDNPDLHYTIPYGEAFIKRDSE